MFMFRIGEFSRIAQVPGSLLRYYDSIDLFSPTQVDEWTGYRYYSAQQLPDLNRILTLKELGLPLEQIRRMLDDDITSEEIRAMLTLRKSQIEESLEEELGRLRTIESRLQQLERVGEGPATDVVIKTIPKQHALLMRRTFRDLPEGVRTLGEVNQIVTQAFDRSVLGNLVVIMQGEVLEPGNRDVELGYTLEKPATEPVALPSGLVLKPTLLPEIPTAITTARVGGPENAHVGYGSLGTWAEANGYRLVSPGREVFLVPPRPGHQDETIVEIQYPAERVAEEATSLADR